MSLKIYQISTNLTNHPDSLANFKKIFNSDDIFSFFVLNLGDEEKIRKRKLDFVAGSGYTLENIVKTDYIYSSTALLFSHRFVKRVGDILNKEMQFFPCQIMCQDVSLEWYAAKLTRQISLIDKELSTYRTLTDGEKVLKFERYRSDIKEPFFIARDSEYSTYFAVSELFLDLCKKHDIMINFREAGDYSWINN